MFESMAGWPTLRRNLLSSFETSAESHNQPFQLLEGVVDATEAGFSAIFSTV